MPILGCESSIPLRLASNFAPGCASRPLTPTEILSCGGYESAIPTPTGEATGTGNASTTEPLWEEVLGAAYAKGEQFSRHTLGEQPSRDTLREQPSRDTLGEQPSGDTLRDRTNK